MARIDYPNLANPALSPLIEKIRNERGGKLLNLYRMLLHSPPLAEAWLGFLTAIRQRCALPGKLRELVIMRIAVINGADYEFRTHMPFALKEGITREQISALLRGTQDAFTDKERAVLAYAEAITRDVHVPDQVFEVLRRHLDEKELVELTATIGAYNLVSRFLEALQIDHD